MPLTLHCLQHVPFEGPAAIAAWAASRGHTLTCHHVYANDPWPVLESLDGLVVMGGPMNIDEHTRYPWLPAEKQFLRAAIAAGKRLVGVCLGAQLLADALGARVTQGQHKEIGWFPLTFTEAGAALLGAEHPRQLEVLHWHGDSFALPTGCRHLAFTAACENQGFLYDDRILALQCHLEATPESVQALVTNCRDELMAAPYIQPAERLLAGSDFRLMHRALYSLLDYVFE